MLSTAKQQLKQALKPVVRSFRTSRPGTIAPQHWRLATSAEGHLAFDGTSIASLRERFGSPLHVVLAPLLRRNIEEFLAINQGGRRRVEIFYSYKSNPVPGVLQFMHDLGIGAEVISEYELWLAFKLGVPPDRVVYNGPAKSFSSMRTAFARDILLLNVNHREEIEPVISAARDVGTKPRIGVRVATSVGWSGQFGSSIASGEAFEAMRQVHESGALQLTALHSHVGGMVRSAAQVRTHVAEILALADRARDQLGVELAMLDLGGSLATPTVAPLTQLDQRLSTALQTSPSPPVIEATIPIRDYVKLIAEQVEDHYARLGRQPPRIMLEPGRAMTGNTQLLLTSVLSLKADQSQAGWAIVDAGINLAECMRNEFHQIFPATRMLEPCDQTYRLAGPICSPGDVIAWSAPLPRLATGDALVLMDAGAYFIPFATSFSFPQPAIVMLDGNEPRLLRRAESFEDLIALDGLEEKSCLPHANFPADGPNRAVATALRRTDSRQGGGLK